jgi:parvulin-like peptidyl-prolyl isomerase
MVRISIILCLYQTVTLGNEILVNRIVGIAGSTPILESTIQTRLKKQSPIMVSTFPAAEEAPLEEKLLQDEINFHLIKRKLESLEITVTDEDVSKEISQFLRTRNLEMSGLRQALAEQGLTYDDYFDDFRNRIIFSRFQGRVIWPRIHITEKALRSHYTKTQGTKGSNLVLRRIRIDTGRYGQQKTEKVMKALRDGQDFAEAAKLYSDDSFTAQSGGLLAEVAFQDLAPEIQKALADLSENDLSEALTLSDGDYIFKLVSRKIGDDRAFNKLRRAIENELSAIESERQIRNWLTEERAKVKIAVVQ